MNTKNQYGSKFIWGAWPLGTTRCIVLLVTLEEVQQFLDAHTIDEIQSFMQCEILRGDLLTALKPYLHHRFKTALGG